MKSLRTRPVAAAFMMLTVVAALRAQPRPNIVWLVAEDINPRYFSAYGDPLADTPTFDRLAREGTRFTHCHATAPVCAPARFCLLTGHYASSFGPAQHMRALARLPAHVHGFPALLRAAGYFTTNNAKTDYNAQVNLQETWDQNGQAAHWRGRKPNQPFFSVFNFNGTHESANWPEAADVAAEFRRKVSLPSWAPENEEARAQLANNYLIARKYDAWVKDKLAELAADGLADDTIVFLYGDNGGTFLRSKRFLYDDGTHVPLAIRVPPSWQAHAGLPRASIVDELVSFVDFAPTILSLAGIDPPAGLPGRPFAGPKRRGPPEFLFAHRDRMGEGYDVSRAVKDSRWCYIRNYLPWQPHGEAMGKYAFRSPAYRAWQQAHASGGLTPRQDAFWQRKPAEELYDLQTDPEQVSNLAERPEHRERLVRMREALRRHIIDTHDNGFTPEGSPCEGFDESRRPDAYPLSDILGAAEKASMAKPADVPALVALLGHADGSMRWWAAKGLAALDVADREALRRRLDDPWPQVRVVAAEALLPTADRERAIAALVGVLADKRGAVLLQAAAALERLDGPLPEAAGRAVQIARKTTVSRGIAENLNQILERLEARAAPRTSDGGAKAR